MIIQAGNKYFHCGFLRTARNLIAMKRLRRNLMLRTVLTLISLSLFYCLFTVLEIVRRINSDHVLRESEVNNHFIGFPSLASRESPNSVYDRTLQSDKLYRDQGRGLKSFPRWRTFKYNTTETNPSEFRRYLGCSDVKAIKVVENIGRGYTKTVQKGIYKGTEIALKSVQFDNEDITHCVKNSMTNRSIDKCFIFAKYKLAKEIIMLQQLQHANIIKLFGFCWQSEQNTADLKTRGLTMVTEIGRQLDVISLVQLPWQERFRLCLGLARLLQYLAHSPLGSLLIRDFKVTQFVLVSGEIKLTDFDDVDNEEPECLSNKDCAVTGTKKNKTLQCDQGRCKGLIAAKNLDNAGRNFINHILVPGAPEHLMVYLSEIKYNLERLTWNSQSLVWHLERVLDLLRSGKHLETLPRLNFYKKVRNADFPNLHDYNCPGSRLFETCELAVYDVTEAQYKCDMDDTCKAFVATGKTLWSGYIIVYLKNNTSHVHPNKDTTVYIKQPT